MRKSGYMVLVPAWALMLALLVYCDLLLISRDAGAVRGFHGFKTGGGGNDGDTVTETADVEKGGNPVIDLNTGNIGISPAGDEGTQVRQEKTPREMEEAFQAGRREDLPIHGEMPLIREEVRVDGNTPEYDLKMELCGGNEEEVYLRIEYYKNGASIVREINKDQIPELAGLLGEEKANGGASGKTAKTSGISQALLNPVYGQLYLLICWEDATGYARAALYMAELDGMRVQRLFSRSGLCGAISCSGNFGMIAYDFKDSPDPDFFREDCIVDVFDCNTGQFLVKNSRDTTGRLIGSDNVRDCPYCYEFAGWKGNGIIRLKRVKIPGNAKAAVSGNGQGGQGGQGGQAALSGNAGNTEMLWEDVLYDVRKNVITVAGTQGMPQTAALAEESAGFAAAKPDARISTDPENGPASSIYR